MVVAGGVVATSKLWVILRSVVVEGGVALFVARAVSRLSVPSSGSVHWLLAPLAYISSSESQF